MMRLLIRYGAHLNAGCERTRTALSQAAYFGYREAIEYLLASGAVAMSDDVTQARLTGHTELAEVDPCYCAGFR